MENKELIKVFESLDDLESEINKDIDDNTLSHKRFPVRFIFLNSHDELKQVVKLITPKYAKKQEISSYLLSENSWFTVNQIIGEIGQIEKSTIIVPLSEYIRFLNDKELHKFFDSLASIENQNIKLYIPLVGLWERFDNVFWRDFYRKDNWAPVWKLDTDDKIVNSYHVNFDFDKEKINTGGLELVSTAFEWFNLWKKDNVDNVISLPNQLSMFFKNSLADNTFNQHILNNPKDYLSKIFDMEINIEYNLKENEFWNELLVDVSQLNKKNISLKDVFIDKFNIYNINNLKLEEFLDYYLKNSNKPYKQWIVKNVFIDFETYKDSYLNYCFKSLEIVNNKNLARKIFLGIFDSNFNNLENYLKERTILLNCLKKKGIPIPEQDFNHYFNNISHLPYNKQLTFLTSNTVVEKRKIIEIIKEYGLDNVVDLKNIFPELYNYLDWNFNLDIPEWIINYFKEYNKSKILNTKSPKIDDLIIKYNNPDKFYDWYYDSNLIKPHLIEDSYNIWIDGLGAEWLPLFIYFLNKLGKNNNKKVTFETIYRVDLPSTTKFNKFDFDKIGDLDKKIHGGVYKYPDSLLEEFIEIEKIAHKLVSLDYPRISIYSDHGFSFLCRKNFVGNKKHNFSNTEHEGRYFLTNGKVFNDDEDYICYKIDSGDYEGQEFVVALKHISLDKIPAREVHGGATPEELLVPFIVLEERGGSVINYEIAILKSSINVSMDLKLPITIYPEPKSLPIAIYNGQQLDVKKINDNKFIINLNKNMEKGKQNIILKINNEKVKDLVVDIKKGGMAVNDMGI